MCWGQNFACRGKIWHLRRQKFAYLKVDLSVSEKILSFLGFSMVKTQKVLKKWSSFIKKDFIFFSIIGGGGPDPFKEFIKPKA